MKATSPRPPAKLQAAGRALWRDLTRAFDFEPFELHAVVMACAHQDLWASSVRGRAKRDRAEARAEAVVVSRLLRELRIHQATDDRPPDLAGRRSRA